MRGLSGRAGGGKVQAGLPHRFPLQPGVPSSRGRRPVRWSPRCVVGTAHCRHYPFVRVRADYGRPTRESSGNRGRGLFGERTFMGTSRRRLGSAFVALMLAVGSLVAASAATQAPADAATVLAPGFSTSTVFSGLSLPTAFEFAPDGKVFVAEKDGVVKVFDNLNDPTPTVFADLKSEVYSYVDRGLLSLTVD